MSIFKRLLDRFRRKPKQEPVTAPLSDPRINELLTTAKRSVEIDAIIAAPRTRLMRSGTSAGATSSSPRQRAAVSDSSDTTLSPASPLHPLSPLNPMNQITPTRAPTRAPDCHSPSRSSVSDHTPSWSGSCGSSDYSSSSSSSSSDSGSSGGGSND